MFKALKADFLRFTLLFVAMLSLGYSTATAARTVTLKLTDKNGDALVNAVVSIPGEPQPPAEQAVMDQVDSQFKPEVLLVPQGTQVLFPNSDNIRHHVYSFSQAKPFEIKLYANEERPSILFNKPGIVALGCNIHDQMRGYIYVSPHAQSQLSNATGEVSFTVADDNLEAIDVLVWHPWLPEANQQQVTIQLAAEATAVSEQIDVAPPVVEDDKPSRLQQRFNRRSGND